MNDKILTDEEIAKALECCISGDFWCNGCPLNGRCCDMTLEREALDLIKRQKAEIAELKRTVDIWMKSAISWSSNYFAEFRYNEQLKIKVGSEIFKEIEKIVSDEIHRYMVIREHETDLSDKKYWEGSYNSLRKLPCCMAELKKKYTEAGGQ